jgi:hypothetical protein
MTEQRQKLIDRFQRWLDTNPRKQIIAAQCANIAEEYADEQLKLYGVSNCGGAIPYDSLSDSFKKSIDGIEDNLNK